MGAGKRAGARTSEPAPQGEQRYAARLGQLWQLWEVIITNWPRATSSVIRGWITDHELPAFEIELGQARIPLLRGDRTTSDNKQQLAQVTALQRYVGNVREALVSAADVRERCPSDLSLINVGTEKQRRAHIGDRRRFIDLTLAAQRSLRDTFIELPMRQRLSGAETQQIRSAVATHEATLGVLHTAVITARDTCDAEQIDRWQQQIGPISRDLARPIAAPPAAILVRGSFVASWEALEQARSELVHARYIARCAPDDRKARRERMRDGGLALEQALANFPLL